MYLFDFLKAVLHFEVNQSGRHSLNIKQYVAYYRVSTSRQTIGLQAQETMVKAYLKDQCPPIKSFTEKESGK